jgi:hypothetical protein
MVVRGLTLVGFLIHSSRDFSSHTAYGTPEIFGARPKTPFNDGPTFLKSLSRLWQEPHCLRVSDAPESDSKSPRFASLFSLPVHADNAAISISGRMLVNIWRRMWHPLCLILVCYAITARYGKSAVYEGHQAGNGE